MNTGLIYVSPPTLFRYCNKIVRHNQSYFKQPYEMLIVGKTIERRVVVDSFEVKIYNLTKVQYAELVNIMDAFMITKANVDSIDEGFKTKVLY